MQSEQFFAAILGLETLWYVGEIYFNVVCWMLTQWRTHVMPSKI